VTRPSDIIRYLMIVELLGRLLDFGRRPEETPVQDAPVSRIRPAKRSRNRPRTSPLPTNQSRWYQADVEGAIQLAAGGDLSKAAVLCKSFNRDGRIQGLMGTRTGGLVRLPKKFAGTPAAVAFLGGADGKPGKFSRYFPDAELIRLDTYGIELGASVAEFVQNEEDEHAILTTLDPEFLLYRWSEDRWYYRSVGGLIPITPGDGRFVLHLPYGKYEPWNWGIWPALGSRFISKDHSFNHRENYSGKLANPARVAIAPNGAAEEQKQNWFQKVMAWGTNAVFGLTPGYDIKLVESNGRGYEVFKDIIETDDTEATIAICGQLVTVTGGAGFANANIHATIRSDLIQGDGNGLAHTLNTQALPHVVHDYCGEGESCEVAWDTRPPADLKAGADSMTATAGAVKSLTEALQPHGIQVDVPSILARFDIPVLGDANGDAKPDAPVDTPAPEPTPGSSQEVQPTQEQAPTEENQASASGPDEAAEALAEKMTESAVVRCEHGAVNRCRICGIERVRDFAIGQDGSPIWSVQWRAIPRGEAQ